MKSGFCKISEKLINSSILHVLNFVSKYRKLDVANQVIISLIHERKSIDDAILKSGFDGLIILGDLIIAKNKYIF